MGELNEFGEKSSEEMRGAARIAIHKAKGVE